MVQRRLPPLTPEQRARRKALDARSKELLEQMQVLSNELASIRRELERSNAPERPQRTVRMKF